MLFKDGISSSYIIYQRIIHMIMNNEAVGIWEGHGPSERTNVAFEGRRWETPGKIS